MTKRLQLAICAKSLPPWFAIKLMEIQRVGIPGFQTDINIVWRGSIQMARDVAAQMALDNKQDRLVFIDSDLKFEMAQLHKLCAHPFPIVCGVYARKQRDVLWEISIKDKTKQPDENGLVEVQGAGAGFLSVDTKVLREMREKLPELSHVDLESKKTCTNWFFQGVRKTEEYPDGVFYGEDMGFMHMAARIGYKTIADTSILIPHEGTADYPLQLAYGFIDDPSRNQPQAPS